MSTLSDSLRDYCERTGTRRPLLRIGENMWAITAGLGLQLQLANRDFAVERGAVFLFTNEFAANGTEDAVITIAPASLHRELVARPDNVVVASVDSVYLDVVRIPPYNGSMRASSSPPASAPRWTIGMRGLHSRRC